MLLSPDQNEEYQDLLQSFKKLQAGLGNSYLEEEDFERLIGFCIDYQFYTRAMEVVDVGLNQLPYSPSLLLEKANLLIIDKKYEQALQVLDAAEILDSSDIDLYILRTDAYLALDMQKKAAELLEEAVERFDSTDKIDLLFELADVYDDYGDFEKVFDCLVMILDIDPVNEEALYKICFWTEFTGRNEESIKLHLKIINEFPYTQLAWFNLGTAYQGLNLHEKAVDAYQYAVAIDEKFEIAYRNLGDAFIRLRNFRDAIDSLQKAQTMSMPDTLLNEAIGYCFTKLKQPAQARFYFKKALNISPSDSALHYRIANTYAEEEKWPLAIKSLETAIKGEPKKAEYHRMLGVAYMAKEKYDAGIKSFQQAVTLKPASSTNWIGLLGAYFTAGKFREGIELSQEAYHRTKGKAIFLYYETAFLFGSRKMKHGLHVLELALRADPLQVKKFMLLDPSFIQINGVAALLNKYKVQKKPPRKKGH